MRGMSYEAGRAALSPEVAVIPATASDNTQLSARQVQNAIQYNLRGHAINMLVQIRNFLIKNGWLSPSAADKGERVNQEPTSIVNADFVQAVAAYQAFKKQANPDGKLGARTFQLFQEQGLGYSLQGGAHAPNRTVIPKDAPDDQVYDYFRGVILSQGGIFMERPGHVNVVGIRGGQLSRAGGIRHVPNTFNQWNDTLVVLSVDAQGNKSVDRYEGTTDPGVARNGVATFPEGTHTMELGYHAPRSGSYTALNPRHNGQVPVFRRNQGFHLGAGARGGQWLNVHTTHGYNRGALPGPGGYSEGCAVINGNDQYQHFIGDMKTATNRHGQRNIFFTLLSAGRLGTLEIDSQENRNN